MYSEILLKAIKSHRRRGFLFLTLLSLTLFFGCDGSNSTRIVPSLDTKASSVFGPDGGTLTIPATGANIYFRQFSLTSTVTVSMEMKSLPVPFTGSSNITGSYYNITPPGLVFGQPVTIGLPSNGETNIAIYTYDGDKYVNRGGTVSNGFIYIHIEGFFNTNTFSNGQFGAVVVKQ